MWAVILRVIFVPVFGFGVWQAWRGDRELGIAVMCLSPVAVAGLESERVRRFASRFTSPY
jgi:hypothetical protein